MKISKTTMGVLRNFLKISNSMVITPGNMLSIINTSGTVLASCRVQETFTHTSGLYDLSRFYQLLQLLVDPELEFEERYVDMTNGSSSARFYFTEKTLIKHPPQHSIPVVNPVLSFTLTPEHLDQIFKYGKATGDSDIVIHPVAGKVCLEVLNSAERNGNKFTIDLGIETKDKFRFGFNSENWVFVPSYGYNVEICFDPNKMRFGRFSSVEDGGINYWVGVEDTSTYGV